MKENIDLVEKFMKLQGLLHKKKFRSTMKQGPMGDSSRGQGRILAFLKMKDGVSTKDMSYVLGVRVSSLNEILSKLEKGGYIEREPSEEDKRVMLIKLTEKGRNESRAESEPYGLFDCLTEEEQVILGGYFDRITAQLEEELAEADPEEFERMCAKKKEALQRMFDDEGEHPHRRGCGHGRRHQGGHCAG